MAITKVTEGVRTLGAEEVLTANIKDGDVTTVKMAIDPTNASNLASGAIPSSRITAVPSSVIRASITGLEDDIALLAFKTQANGSLARYNLVDQSVDAFEDASGVDASASTNEVRDAGGKFYSGSDDANYFGDETLGDCTFGASSITQANNTTGIDTVLSTGSASGGPGTSSYGANSDGVSNVPNSTACYELTVPNTNGSYDGDMVVAQFKDLTIDANVTLTTKQPTRGMFIYVTGDCVINGSLSMTSRGALANPTSSGGSDTSAVPANGLQIGLRTSGGGDTFTNDGSGFAGSGTGVKTAIANQGDISSNGTIFTMTRAGGTGGASYSGSGRVAGTAGTAPSTSGVSLSTGGGGGGGTGNWSSANSVGGRAGALAGVFGGGSGGGGFSSSNNTYTVTPTVGTDYGGSGGAGGRGPHGDARSGGGAGNAGGAGAQGSHCCGNAGDSGTGGIIWLVVKGDLTIGASGTIEGDGGNGGSTGGTALESGGGGGAGGGSVHALHGGTLSNSGNITANAGGGGSGRANGGAGGAGGVNTTAILGSFYLDMTLVSNTFTSVDAVTKGDIVMTYTNGAGTATLNTDLKGWISRDNGANYTQATLTSQGTTGGHTIVTSHDVTLGGTDTSQMRWKVTTHNQSVAKQTRIQAVSLGWT